MAYRHTDFWQCMDTLRDKLHLEELWQAGNPPWKTWDDVAPDFGTAETNGNAHAKNRLARLPE